MTDASHLQEPAGSWDLRCLSEAAGGVSLRAREQDGGVGKNSCLI